MLTEEVLKEIRCAEVKENEDGSATLIFDVTNSFKDVYMEAFQLNEWSQDHFNEKINSILEIYIKYKNDTNPC